MMCRFWRSAPAPATTSPSTWAWTGTIRPPALDALTDGVEQRIDLGLIGGRTFVNNASFGAYAAVNVIDHSAPRMQIGTIFMRSQQRSTCRLSARIRQSVRPAAQDDAELQIITVAGRHSRNASSHANGYMNMRSSSARYSA
jgi:hypothetical protein